MQDVSPEEELIRLDVTEASNPRLNRKPEIMNFIALLVTCVYVRMYKLGCISSLFCVF